MTISRVGVVAIGATATVEIVALIAFQYMFSGGNVHTARLIETFGIVVVPTFLMLLPCLMYRTRAIVLPSSGASLVYLITGLVMSFLAFAIGPHVAGAVLFVGFAVQVVAAGANFFGAQGVEA